MPNKFKFIEIKFNGAQQPVRYELDLEQFRGFSRDAEGDIVFFRFPSLEGTNMFINSLKLYIESNAAEIIKEGFHPDEEEMKMSAIFDEEERKEQAQQEDEEEIEIDDDDDNEETFIQEQKTLDEVFELALENDKYIPQFIDYHRDLCGDGDEVATLEQLSDLLSDTDNGLRLLAACCVYVIDNPDIECNVENWIEECIGDDTKKQETLFKYMLLETAGLKNKNEFIQDYFTEALDAMGVEYDEEALAEILEDIDTEKLPKLSSIRV